MGSTAVPAVSITHTTVGKDLTEIIIEVDISKYPTVLPLDNFDLLVALHNRANGERSISLVNLGTCAKVSEIGPELNITTAEVRKGLTELIIEIDISDYSIVAPLDNYSVLVGLQNDVNGERAVSDDVCLASP